MKIDRRSFLSFVIGGAVGTQLSPLPWKLTDDSSIWSQMWPWTPVPPDGAYSHIRSACTLCPGGCGISVRKVDRRAVKIEGLAGHPVNDGGICLLGLSGLQLLYGPTRVKAPLKRVGKRGEGKWKRISWDEAIDEVAASLVSLRKKRTPERFATITGTGPGTVSALLHRFSTVFGSPNMMTMPSFSDYYDMMLYRSQGVRATVGYDLEKSDFILSFGSGLLDGWGSPVRVFRFNSLRKEKKIPLVQVEPRLSNSAAKADQWVPVIPGTEADLALGLIYVILSESRYDRRFVEAFSTGFEGWKKAVLRGYAPEKVEKKTGVDRSVIVALARRFAESSKPLALCGKGRGRARAESMREVAAVHCLNALAGNINRPGGVFAVPQNGYIDWPEPETDEVASLGLQKDRFDQAGRPPFEDAVSLVDNFIARLAGERLPVELLFVAEANPVYQLANSTAVKDAFERIPKIVSFSSFMDETAAMADLILPNHVYLERYEDVQRAEGIPYPVISLSVPVVTPQFDTKNLGDVIISLAGRLEDNMTRAFPWEDFETCLKETLGDKFEILEEQGFWVDEDYTPPAWYRSFETESGRFVFDEAYVNGYPKIAAPGNQKGYPLTLITYDSMRIASGPIGSPPFMVKTVSDKILLKRLSFVQINPKTAASYGIARGDTVLISTPAGSGRFLADVTEEVMPSVIAVPTGLGHTAYDGFIRDKGVNANSLMLSVIDKASGFNAAWGVKAGIKKV